MPSATTESPERIQDYSRLSRAELALILQFHDEGLTQVAIATKVGCSQATVSRTLQDFSSTTHLAKLRANNQALKVAEAAIKGSIQAAHNGKPESALELLDRLDIAPKRRDEASSSQVTVIVQQANGIPGITPALSPVPHRDLPCANED